jgi:hypothetical protein
MCRTLIICGAAIVGHQIDDLTLLRFSLRAEKPQLLQGRAVAYGKQNEIVVPLTDIAIPVPARNDEDVIFLPVCTENLNPDVMVMQPAKDECE